MCFSNEMCFIGQKMYLLKETIRDRDFDIVTKPG